MSKWLQVLLMLLGSAVTIALTVYMFKTEGKYSKLGKTATVNPAFELIVEPRKDGAASRLGQMSYVDVNGKQVQFKRYLDAKILSRLERKEAVNVQYIPNEWNTERFAGEDARLSAYVLSCLAFLAGLAYVIRKPAPGEDELPQSSALGKLIIRIKLGVMAAAGVLAGALGLIQGSPGHGMTDGVLLVVGIFFAGLFAMSLKMR